MDDTLGSGQEVKKKKDRFKAESLAIHKKHKRGESGGHRAGSRCRRRGVYIGIILVSIWTEAAHAFPIQKRKRPHFCRFWWISSFHVFA